MNNSLKFYVFFLLAFIFLGQSVYAYKCPNYEFRVNFQKGSTDEDVRVIQEILNLDKRTLVAYSGLGSKGNETPLFGKATREALKRFQALFIEYIGIADGKFNDKTRAVMNNVCKGPFFTGGSKSVYDLATSTKATSTKDTLPPIVGIASVSTTTPSQPVRAYLAFSEPVKAPTLVGLIIDGATAGDIRKLSSTTYSFLVTPNEDVRNKITLQFEADTFQDLAGNKNARASNEWTIYIFRTDDPNIVNATQTLPIDLPTVDLPTITTDPSGVDCSTQTVLVTDYTNPCYGKSQMTSDPSQASSGGGGGGGGGAEQIMKMLEGMMKALGGGGGKEANGKDDAPSICACSGIPTVNHTSIGGGLPGGRTQQFGTPGTGFINGHKAAPVFPCGTFKNPPPPTAQCDINCQCNKVAPGSMTNTPACCGITQDMTKGIITGGEAPDALHSGG